MAIDAKELTVASDALPRIGSRLLVVHRDEIRTVHRIPHRFVEAEPRRNRRDGDSVTGAALALGMALGAEVALRVGLHPVLSKEIPVVDDVALGQRHFARQVDMTTAAISGRPLTLVRMTAEARRVLDPHIVRVDRHVDVAAHTIARAFLAMELVREPKVASRHFGRASIASAAVAVGAGIGVVGVLMALDAVRSRREVEGAFLTGALDAIVTLQTIDAFDHVGTMLERVVFSFLLESQHLGACPCEAG